MNWEEAVEILRREANEISFDGFQSAADQLCEIADMIEVYHIKPFKDAPRTIYTEPQTMDADDTSLVSVIAMNPDPYDQTVLVMRRRLRSRLARDIATELLGEISYNPVAVRYTKKLKEWVKRQGRQDDENDL